MNFPKARNHYGWLVPAGLVLGLAWLVWLALGSEEIQFLPGGGAPWIVYPSPLDGGTIAAVELPADFHRQVVLAQKPATAAVEWRCFKQGRILINGEEAGRTDGPRWKRSARADVAGLLRQGTNDIEAIVAAASGPPALSVKLQANQTVILTDNLWDVSYAGALRLPARLAETGPEATPGLSLFGSERTATAWGRVWPWECLFLAISLPGAWLLRRMPGRWEKPVFAAVGVCWLALLAHNIRALPICLGFDASAHLSYIKYIQTRGSLPLADQGWEMFQAPLYYILGAGLLRLCQCATFSPAAMLLLRAFNVAVGAANIALIFAGSRMIFPGQWKKQLAGTALAAFVPWHLYMLHYTTNEVLAGMLGTASLCLCLRCLRAERPSLGEFAALGAVLGAACLTKVSALGLLPVIFAVLAGKLSAQGERRPVAWLARLGLVAGLVVAISGWHYARMWRHFGGPFAGMATRSLVHPWWQQPGYLTGAYFRTFGASLTAPYFAGYHSFWGALHSTLWGDGLWGGWIGSVGGPPWNYDFMTLGYVFALLPALLVLTGVVVGLAELMRRPRLDLFLLAGVFALFFFALALLTLKIPYCSQTKAFYALPALLPFCAAAVAGFDFWQKRAGRMAGFCALVLGGVWLLNNYAAFWIHTGAPQTELCVALANYEVRIEDPKPQFEKVLAAESRNASAELHLALLDRQAGRMDAFAAETEKAFRDHPEDSEIVALAAERLARQDNWAAALPLAEHAARLAPDNYAVALSWLRFARHQQRYADVIAAGKLVLRDRPREMETHRAMADAFSRLGQTNAAALHAAVASRGAP